MIGFLRIRPRTNIARRLGRGLRATRGLLRAQPADRGRVRMMDRDSLFAFWRQPAPQGNEPVDYIAPVWRSEALCSLVADVPPESRILEVGCNVGRKLAYLADRGYRNLEGVEISAHAVRLLRETYPQLAQSRVQIGAAEDVLPVLEGPYDLVFTMAVLQHIHPDSSAVFDHLARLSRVLLTVEPAFHAANTDREFPHDLRSVFARRGLVLVSETPMSAFPALATEDLSDYVALRFTH